MIHGEWLKLDLALIFVGFAIAAVSVIVLNGVAETAGTFVGILITVMTVVNRFGVGYRT